MGAIIGPVLAAVVLIILTSIFFIAGLLVFLKKRNILNTQNVDSSFINKAIRRWKQMSMEATNKIALPTHPAMEQEVDNKANDVTFTNRATGITKLQKSDSIDPYEIVTTTNESYQVIEPVPVHENQAYQPVQQGGDREPSNASPNHYEPNLSASQENLYF